MTPQTYCVHIRSTKSFFWSGTMSGADTKSLFTMSTVLAIYTSTKICNNIIERTWQLAKNKIGVHKTYHIPLYLLQRCTAVSYKQQSVIDTLMDMINHRFHRLDLHCFQQSLHLELLQYIWLDIHKHLVDLSLDSCRQSRIRKLHWHSHLEQNI